MIARRSAAVSVVIIGLAMAALESRAAPKQPPPLKIGMVNSLFRDLSDAKAQTLLSELQNLMREHTGLEGEFTIGGDALELGKRLNDNGFQFGVFCGFEFAWVRQSHPDLKPLLVAINRQRNLKAFVAVLSEGTASALADLKGKNLSIPRQCPQHCHLFLERELGGLGTAPKEFFAKIVQHDNVEEALDDVLRKKVQAALVDGEGLDVYAQVNPGRFARLKMVSQAEGFPPGLLAYRPGAIDDETVAKFKAGMIKANTAVSGKEQLALWKLTAFEPVPADYDSMLSEILKRYPAPKGKLRE